MTNNRWQLENSRFRMVIQPQGGEICSLWDNALNREWMWHPQENIWNNSATQLFPVIGRLIHQGIWQDERFFPLPAHGFLRHQAFSCIEHTGTVLTLEAKASDATRAIWPWQWRVAVRCELTDDGLIFSQQIINEDQHPFWFSIGWHPGFALPLYSEAGWQVCFGDAAVTGPLPTHNRTLDVPAIPPQVKKYPLETDSFRNGALYFGECSKRDIRICAPDGKTVMSMETGEYEWLALWGIPGAELLCVEPLTGTTEAPDFDGQVENKRGMQPLPPGTSRTFRIRLRFPVDA